MINGNWFSVNIHLLLCYTHVNISEKYKQLALTSTTTTIMISKELHSRKCIIVFGFLMLNYFVGFSQSASDVPHLNRAFHKLFTGDELSTIIDEDPLRMERLNFYLTQSFTVELVNCSECEVDYEDLFNHSLFNMYENEALRLADETYEFVYRGKYRIRLLPSNVMSTEIGNISIYELIHGIPFRDFPVWVISGNDDIDFQKAEVYSWSEDFPKEYKAILTSTNMLKIRYTQFKELSNERKVMLLQSENGCFIIDNEIINF